MSNAISPARPVPARVQRRLALRSSGAPGTHKNRKFDPKGGRQGGRRSAIREQG